MHLPQESSVGRSFLELRTIKEKKFMKRCSDKDYGKSSKKPASKKDAAKPAPKKNPKKGTKPPKKGKKK